MKNTFKNTFTIIIGIGALLIVGAAILGYYLGLQKYNDETSYLVAREREKKETSTKELTVELAPNGMPMDLYLEEQEKIKRQTVASQSQPLFENNTKKGLNILTDVKTIIERENIHKERIKELKKISEEEPDSPKALSKESIKQMEEQGLSEQ